MTLTNMAKFNRFKRFANSGVWCSTSNVLLGKYELFVSVLRQDDHRFCAIFFAPFQIAKVGGALRGILTVLEEDPNSFL